MIERYCAWLWQRIGTLSRPGERRSPAPEARPAIRRRSMRPWRARMEDCRASRQSGSSNAKRPRLIEFRMPCQRLRRPTGDDSSYLGQALEPTQIRYVRSPEQGRSISREKSITHCKNVIIYLSLGQSRVEALDQSSNRMQLFSIPRRAAAGSGAGLPHRSVETNSAGG